MRLVYLTLGWAAGIALVESSGGTPALLWAALTPIAGLAAWLSAPSRWRWLAFAVVAFTLGGLRASFLPQTSPLAAYNDSGGLTITGRVIAEPDIRDEITLLRVRAKTVEQAGQVNPTRGDVLVRAPSTTPAGYGDTVRATGQLTTPGVYDTFSYADYLAQRGVFSVLRDTAVEVVQPGRGNPVYAWLLQQKARAADSINRAMPEPMAGLMVGILLGNERGLSPELQADFAATGAAHIVAISGFNMVILAGVVESLLSQSPLRGRAAAFIALAVIGVYTVFVGANAAVVRAAVMTAVLVVGRALNRKTYVPASLALVALLMSAANPRVLWDVSFQLSFFATLGLALFSDPLARTFDTLLERVLPPNAAAGVSGFLSEPVIVTLAALVPTLPLTALYFNRVSLVQIPVNLLIVPVQAVVLVSGIAATLVNRVAPPVAQVIYWFDMVLLWWSVTVVRVFADLPFAEVEFYTGSAPIVVFFVAMTAGAVGYATQPEWVLAVARFARTRAVFNTTMLVGVVMVGLNIASLRSRPDGDLHVWLLDVGHSNGVLVQTPAGAQLLIDGGRFPSRLLTQIGDRMPFHDRHIEVLAVTQPDEFQYGALPALLRRYDVGAVLTNGQPNLSAAYAELQTALAPFDGVTVTAGYTVQFGDGVRLEVLGPQHPPELTDSLDRYALVLRLTYGEAAFLFTSDLSVEGQADLLGAGYDPVAQVMQLPQHGTTRSLDAVFLGRVQPQVVLLQADATNRRGDPDPDVITRLQDYRAGIPLFRTDASGVVHIRTDGQTLWVAE